MTPERRTKPVMETERLRLRPIEDRDVDSIVALDADPEVRRFLHMPNPTSRDEVVNGVLPRVLAFDVNTPEIGFWMVELRESAEFLGWFHLRPPKPFVPQEPGDQELGYRFVRAAWGKGLATEGGALLVDYGLRVLRAPRVTALCLKDNVRSWKVMERLGMTLWRDWLYPDVGDSFIYERRPPAASARSR